MNNGSSNKAFIFVVVAVIVVIAAWFMMRDQGTTTTTDTATNTTQTQTGTKAEDLTASIRSSGVSDSSFDEDQATIDAQLNLLNQEALDAAQ